jgi:hypothetical protein
MKNTTLAFLLGAGAIASLAVADTNPPTPAALTVSVGADYTRGDYGFATDTEVFSAPVNVGYETGAWTLSASVPWITVRGPAATTGAGGAARPTSASESGMGDALLGASYRFGEVIGPVNLAFTARVKLPTSDADKGLGTGETDFYGQLDFYRTFDAWTPFASVGYRALGDSAIYQLEDGLYLSAGSHFRASDKTVWTIAGNWGRAILAGGDATVEAMVAVNHDFSPQWRVTGYALKGFSDASPDHGGGLAISHKF